MVTLGVALPLPGALCGDTVTALFVEGLPESLGGAAEAIIEASWGETSCTPPRDGEGEGVLEEHAESALGKMERPLAAACSSVL